MRAAQADVFSPASARLQTADGRRGAGRRLRRDAVLDQLTAWDGVMRADAAEPLIFTAWVREAVRAIYGDDLGAAFTRYFDTRALRSRACWRAGPRAATGATTARRRRAKAAATCWPPRLPPPSRTSRGATAPTARSGGGAPRTTPSASTGRSARFAGIGRFFNVEVPSPGGTYTLNRGKEEFGEEPPFANRHASSYRAIYDLADLDRSLYIHTTGQSGNPFSPFYRSFAERWAKVEYIEIATKRAEIDKAAIGTWKLSPQ